MSRTTSIASESMARRTLRQAKGLLAFRRKHGKTTKGSGKQRKVRWSGVFCSVGIVGALASLLLLRGGVGVATAVAFGVGAAGSAAVHHHRRNRVINHGNSRRATLGEKRAWAQAQRNGTAPPQPAGGTVHVGGHTRDGATVGGYTRAAPGQANGQPRKPRTWNGAPESPADTRFFDLRESGYKGPIDQDGRKVDDQKAWEDKHRRPAWRDRYDAEQGGKS